MEDKETEAKEPQTAVIPPVKQLSSRDRSNLNLLKAKQFVAGVSGNPKGRPTKEKCITTILKAKLEEQAGDGKTWAEKIANAMLIKAASNDSTKGTASVLKEVLERVEGKVTEDISIRSEGNVILNWHPTKEDTEAND